MINWIEKKEELERLINAENMPYETIGKLYGVSGAAVKKGAVKVGINVPNRRVINRSEHFNKGKYLKDWIQQKCLYCGKEFNTSSENIRYCSNQCRKNDEENKEFTDWKKTGKSVYLTERIKKYIFDKYNNSCCECGWNVKQSSLKINYIDSNYKNLNENNLNVLCPNCWSLMKKDSKKESVDFDINDENSKQIFENYYITKDGKIYSELTHKFLKTRIQIRGYEIVNLTINHKCKTFQVHRLVAKAFLPNPDNLEQVNHKNGVKIDNRVENLEWCTPSENIKHAIDNGIIINLKGCNSVNGKFSEEEVKEIRKLYEEGYSQRELSKMYNVTKGAIQQMVEFKTYKFII